MITQLESLKTMPHMENLLLNFRVFDQLDPRGGLGWI
jgi:hypothetical protein